MLYTEYMMSFQEYLFSKLQDFEKEQGRRISLDSFAGNLGVSRPLVSYWLSGKTKPSAENIRILASKLGPEVYDILGLTRPDPDLQAITYVWDLLPEESRRFIREQAEALVEGKVKKKNNNDQQTSESTV